MNPQDLKDLKPHFSVQVYGWDFCLLENGEIVARNLAKKLPWARAKQYTVSGELSLDDARLGNLIYTIRNVKANFPKEGVFIARPEPRKPQPQKNPLVPV